MNKTILVTGGAGYIGSHTCVELLNAGYDIVIVDNLSNSKPEAVRRIGQITGKNPPFYPLDVADVTAMRTVFQAHRIDAVIHFAGFKAVGESCQQPLSYYRNNLDSTLALAELMAEFHVAPLVFSSSATVYGDPHTVPVMEDFPLSATNPYGRTKLFIEGILRDLAGADTFNTPAQHWKIALLRYFNPAGAHESGLIGEDPNGIPNNLLPYLAQVAIGKLEKLSIFGNDYPTVDGTGVRDYIHVVDLARGHLAALAYLLNQAEDSTVCEAFNLGTGQGYSVLEMVNTFMAVTSTNVPYQFTARRSGDIASCYGDPTRAKEKLHWQAEKNLSQMLADTWRWQTQNPDGYS